MPRNASSRVGGTGIRMPPTQRPRRRPPTLGRRLVRVDGLFRMTETDRDRKVPLFLVAQLQPARYLLVDPVLDVGLEVDPGPAPTAGQGHLGAQVDGAEPAFGAA